MSSMLLDLRFGLRMLFKQPVIALVCILTLAIGIGATTAIFSIVKAALFAPLGFEHAERLVAIWETKSDGKQPRYRVAPANFYDWREQSSAFSSMAAFGAADMVLTGVGDPEQVRGAVVTPSYFRVLSVKPLLGRTFLAEESKGQGPLPVILSAALWQRYFGSDARVIGRSITLDGNAYTVVGVLAPGIFPVWPATTGKFSFDQGQQQFYVPLTETAQQRTNRRSHVWGVIGQLRPDASLETAQRDLGTIASRLATEYPQSNSGTGIEVRPFVEELTGKVRRGLWILFAAVGVVLMTACANVAGLLLARYTTRQREVAIRAALGANRWRLAQQFLTESLLLSILGGAAGIWCAVVVFDLLVKMVPEAIPRVKSISLDPGVLTFATLVSLGCTLLFGLAPALHATRGASSERLEDGTRGSSASSRSLLPNGLVSLQVALATVLLIAASLLVRSYRELIAVEPGFNSSRLMLADLSIPPTRYDTLQKVTSFYSDLAERVRVLPDVQSVAFAYDHPLEANWIDSFTIEDQAERSDAESLSAFLRIISSGYFATAGVRLIRGREFTSLDDASHPGVLVINQAFEKRFFSQEDALGKRLRITSPRGSWGVALPESFEIVGIVEGERFLGLNTETPPAYYISDRQFPQSSMNVLVRTLGDDPLSIAGSLRQAVMSLDSAQPLANVRDMDSIVSTQTAQQRFNTMLMSFFGLVAVLLSTIGIVGLISYQVSQRLREFGIRVALGATPRSVQWLAIRNGTTSSLFGVGVGLALAWALGRSIAALLFGIDARDLMTFAIVGSLMPCIAFVAAWIPARRATKVNPTNAMKAE